MNIVLPKGEILPKNKLAVFVWIHGGGLGIGSAFEHENAEICRNLVSQNIITVVIQYRLGWAGFLSTGDKAAPGNIGIHDQIAALKWIHENIGSFGGDTERITIGGESSGGDSVAMLSYITQAQPYFSQAIVQSGNAFNNRVGSETSVDSTKKLATALGCTGDSGTTVSCLKSKPAEEIQKVHLETIGPSYLRQKKKIPGREYIGGGHGVVVQIPHWYTTEDDILIPKGGFYKLANTPSNKPFIIGSCKQEYLEGIVPRPAFREYMTAKEPYLQQPVLNIDDLQLSTILENLREAFFAQKNYKKAFTYDSSKAKKDTLAEKMSVFAYITSRGNPENKTFLTQALTEMANDICMNAGVALNAQVQKKRGSPVWLFSFDHVREQEFPDDWAWKGASHGADLIPLFTRVGPFGMTPSTEKDGKVSKLMCKLWTNFIKYGQPTREDEDLLGLTWPQFESLTNMVHLKIKENPEVNSDFHQHGVTFWNLVYPELVSAMEIQTLIRRDEL